MPYKRHSTCKVIMDIYAYVKHVFLHKPNMLNIRSTLHFSCAVHVFSYFMLMKLIRMGNMLTIPIANLVILIHALPLC